MELHHIPLENLTVSAINSRTHGVKEGLDSLTASIRAQGLLQPLLVRPVAAGEGYEIVAGQRRYLACQRIAQDVPVEPLPCFVLAATDDAAALEISLAENVERLPMEPFDQHEAFARLVKLGQDVETIAARFGVTERLVKQRLALANLTDAIKREARKGAVGIADAQRLALATPKQQKAWFKRYRDREQYTPQGSQLKAWLCGGAAIATEVALFPLEDYGGRIVADLFGEQSYFDDAATFWTLQNQAIAALRDRLLAEGWTRVEVLETGDFFKSWEHQRTPMERGGGVFVSPQRTGEVLVHEGYVPLKEARRQARQAVGMAAGTAATEDAPKPARSEATQALQNYLALHKAAAVRYALAQNPTVALRLAVACLIGGATNWAVRADRTPPHGPAVAASVEASAAFADERRTVWRWLGDAAESAGRGPVGTRVRREPRRRGVRPPAGVERRAGVESAGGDRGRGPGGGRRLGRTIGRIAPDRHAGALATRRHLFGVVDRQGRLDPDRGGVGRGPDRQSDREGVARADSPPLAGGRVSAGRGLAAALLGVPDPRLHRAARVGGPRRLRQAGAGWGRRGHGAAHGAEDETGFEAEDTDETGTVTEWDEAA